MNATHELPPLPEPTDTVDCRGAWNGDTRIGSYPVWDAEAMREYARAAVAKATGQSI